MPEQVRKLTVEEYQNELRAQGSPSHLDLFVICPMCKCLQSPRDFLEAGAAETEAEAMDRVVYECLGRELGAPMPRVKPDGNRCNWSLNGFLKVHRVVVILPEGGEVSAFEPATPEDAQRALALRQINEKAGAVQ